MNISKFEALDNYVNNPVFSAGERALSEHLYNITNLGLNIHSDMLCDISKRKIEMKFIHSITI
ncbi:hypothetical protein [uncultured Chitinophaga sp.]|jgi:hypothetical protein|uniref:hypothetical protein n=1 Tax=uncultured Chitinophaga sp. TaxID=339340 RepID=UPI0026351DFE|nr:hypothetical protein [uncultured Chitinophaga sp.]